MKISVIIPNYNGENLLKKNLPKVIDSIKEYKDNAEIIIADDSSTDNSLEVIKKIISENSEIKLKLVTSSENQGFSSNVNKGVKEASGDILILLNTDVSPQKNFIKPLLDYFNDEKVFAVGSLDESVEDGKIIKRGRGKGKWSKGFLIHNAADIDSVNINTLWVSGGSGAFRKSVWDKLGGLDELYNPFYWEDIDLSYRALKSGYKVIFEKNSIVRHEHEEGVIRKKFKPKQIRKIVYRNQFIFAWKNSDFKNLIFGLVFLPLHLLNSVKDKDFDFWKGFFLAVLKIPIIINYRFKVYKKFNKTDSEIVSNIN